MNEPGPELPRISIAIVDDEETVRVSLWRLCLTRGLDATAFDSGQAFLDALEQNGFMPDCVLLDAHMPRMNGLEVQQRLIARQLDLPLVLITADDSPEVLDRYRAAGFTEQLRKPFRTHEMLHAIERAIAHRNAPASAIRPFN